MLASGLWSLPHPTTKEVKSPPFLEPRVSNRLQFSSEILQHQELWTPLRSPKSLIRSESLLPGGGGGRSGLQVWRKMPAVLLSNPSLLGSRISLRKHEELGMRVPMPFTIWSKTGKELLTPFRQTRSLLRGPPTTLPSSAWLLPHWKNATARLMSSAPLLAPKRPEGRSGFSCVLQPHFLAGVLAHCWAQERLIKVN